MKAKRFKILVLFIITILCFSGCSKINLKGTQSDKISNEKVTNKEKQSDEKIEEYNLKANVIYYILNDEYLENSDVDNPNVSQLVMQFMCYDGIKDSIYPYTNIVMLDRVNTIEESREKLLLDNPDKLKLPPNTIVSINVLNKWKSQDYDGSSSYTDESQKDFNYSQIQ